MIQVVGRLAVQPASTPVLVLLSWIPTSTYLTQHCLFGLSVLLHQAAEECCCTTTASFESPNYIRKAGRSNQPCAASSLTAHPVNLYRKHDGKNTCPKTRFAVLIVHR
ncbi:hypothetical protein F4814DRAFT_414703 [Daldinia grandis]|nr:hypothetical protein F4814DRAFT_414703 [Daldinia grandis]